MVKYLTPYSYVRNLLLVSVYPVFVMDLPAALLPNTNYLISFLLFHVHVRFGPKMVGNDCPLTICCTIVFHSFSSRVRQDTISNQTIPVFKYYCAIVLCLVPERFAMPQAKHFCLHIILQLAVVPHLCQSCGVSQSKFFHFYLNARKIKVRYKR